LCIPYKRNEHPNSIHLSIQKSYLCDALCIILLALICGLFIDTSSLKNLLLPVAMLTIFPEMIGFQPRELLKLTDLRLLSANLLLNFMALPLAALLIGMILLEPWPELRLGLLISCLCAIEIR